MEVVSAAEKGECCFLNLHRVVEAFLLTLKAIGFSMNVDGIDLQTSLLCFVDALFYA